MTTKSKKSDLTPEEERFVEEYLIDRNGTAAYIRAHPGTKRTTAGELASRLLKKVKVRTAVASGEKDLRRRSRVKAERVVEHAARIAFLDIGDVLDLSVSDFRPLPPREIPQDIRRAIQAVKVTRRRLRSRGDEDYEVESVEYKLPDKNAALDKLFRHLGLYKDLPPLEVLLGLLPPDIRAAVRANLESAVLEGGDPGGARGDQPRVAPAVGGDAQPSESGPDVPNAGGGAHPGPVAASPDYLPVPPDRGPLHPPVGEDADGRQPGVGPLLDPE